LELGIWADPKNISVGGSDDRAGIDADVEGRVLTKSGGVGICLHQWRPYRLQSASWLIMLNDITERKAGEEECAASRRTTAGVTRAGHLFVPRLFDFRRFLEPSRTGPKIVEIVHGIFW